MTPTPPFVFSPANAQHIDDDEDDHDHGDDDHDDNHDDHDHDHDHEYEWPSCFRAVDALYADFLCCCHI